MNSLEKIEAFKQALLRGDEVYDGMLGLVQGLVAQEKLGGPSITAELPADPQEFDAALVDVAGFCLWLRSDDAPAVDAEMLAHRMPDAIAELVEQMGAM